MHGCITIRASKCESGKKQANYSRYALTLTGQPAVVVSLHLTHAFAPVFVARQIKKSGMTF